MSSPLVPSSGAAPFGRLVKSEAPGRPGIQSEKQTQLQETTMDFSNIYRRAHMYLYMVSFWLSSCSRQSAKPPQVIALSVCADAPRGMHRISSDFGIRFDAPEKAFVVREASRDMPAGMMYIVRLRDADAHLVIWQDDDVFRDLKNAYPVFSKHVENRPVRDATGRNSGTDQWGYLPDGRQWRYVRFSTGDAVGYDPAPPTQARLLDEIINSACY